MFLKISTLPCRAPRFFKVAEALPVTKVEKNRLYLELDGLDGDKFNSNWDLFPWNPDYCPSCDQYIYDMDYKGIKFSASDDETCPNCGDKLDGGLLAHNSQGQFGWQSWIKRPLCVGHKSDDQTRHYGEILDALPVRDKKTIRMVASVDRDHIEKHHPGLLSRYEHGESTDVSQGSKVVYSLCSKCGHKAAKEEDYCEHIKLSRGRLLPLEKNDRPYIHAIENGGFVRVGEICYDVSGYEMSLVPHGACDVAVVHNVLKAAAKEQGLPLPVSGLEAQLGRRMMRTIGEFFIEQAERT